MSKNESSKSALELVDGRRRRFLGKLLAGGAAAAALPMMSTVAFGAAQTQSGGKGKGGKGKGGGGKGGGGKGAKGKGGSSGQGGAQPDPKEMAARLIKEHDKDGDGKLNVTELEAALKAMQKHRETMGNGAPGGAGKGKGGGGKGKGGKGKGGSAAPGGGVKPNRPETE